MLIPAGFLYGAFIFFSRVFLRRVVETGWLVKAAMMLSTPFGMLIDVVITLAGFQFLLFAMWIDMENNRHLNS